MANLRIKEAYEAVFDEDGNIKACGRAACIRLIEACQEKDQSTYFGDKETGILNLSTFDKMKQLYLDEK